MCCTKVAKNWHFFELFGNFLLTLYWSCPENWDNSGRYALIGRCTKIHIFLRITIETLLKMLWKWDICAAHTMWNHVCKKLQKIAKNWTFFQKKADLRLFWAFLPDFMGDMWQICGGNELAQKLQKIALFLEKMLIY